MQKFLSWELRTDICVLAWFGRCFNLNPDIYWWTKSKCAKTWPEHNGVLKVKILNIFLYIFSISLIFVFLGDDNCLKSDIFVYFNISPSSQSSKYELPNQKEKGFFFRFEGLKFIISKLILYTLFCKAPFHLSLQNASYIVFIWPYLRSFTPFPTDPLPHMKSVYPQVCHG